MSIDWWARGSGGFCVETKALWGTYVQRPLCMLPPAPAIPLPQRPKPLPTMGPHSRHVLHSMGSSHQHPITVDIPFLTSGCPNSPCHGSSWYLGLKSTLQGPKRSWVWEQGWQSRDGRGEGREKLQEEEKRTFQGRQVLRSLWTPKRPWCRCSPALHPTGLASPGAHRTLTLECRK